MKATAVEVRLRWAILAAIYVLGFVAVPLALRVSPELKEVAGFSDKSTWLVLSSLISRQGWLTFSAATTVLLIVALLLTGLGAWLRTWGAAYREPRARDESVVAGGAYGHSRNPLALGMMLHVAGIAILMPPGGAVFAVVLTGLFEARLVLAAEARRAVQMGEPYTVYKTAVPGFLPAATAQVGDAGGPADWVRAVAAELYFVLAFGVLVVLGWGFNAQPILQGLLISAGVWVIVRALLPVKRGD